MAGEKLRFIVGGMTIDWDDKQLPVGWKTYSERTHTLNYQNASGQQLTAGQLLYENGINTDPGYLIIRNLYDTTLIGTGSLQVSIGYMPPDPFVSSTVTIDLLGSPIILYIQ